MPGNESSRSNEGRKRLRRTARLVALILVCTALLVGVKYWVVSRYLLGH